MRTLLPGMLLAVLAACGSDSGGGNSAAGTGSIESEEREVAYIEGRVSYRERIMLPPGVVLEVQLLDVSRADVAADILTTFTSMPDGGPPYPFRIEYDPGHIQERRDLIRRR